MTKNPGQHSSRYKAIGSISSDGKRKKVKEGVWADISDGKISSDEEGKDKTHYSTLLSENQNSTMNKLHDIVDKSENPEKERVHNIVEDLGHAIAQDNTTKQSKLKKEIKNAVDYPKYFDDAKESSNTYKSKSKSNLVGSTNFGMASNSMQEKLHNTIGSAEKILEEIGFTFKTPVDFFCGNIELNGLPIGGLFTSFEDGSGEILLATTETLEKSLMHEIGHAMDHAMSKESLGFRSQEFESKKAKDPELSKHFDRISSLVKSTSFYSDVVEKDSSYFLDPAEVFARGFELYSYYSAKGLEESGKIEKGFTDKFYPDISYAPSTVASEQTIADHYASMREHASSNGKFDMKSMSAIDNAEDESIKSGTIPVGDSKSTEQILHKNIKESMDYILKHDIVKKAMKTILNFKRRA